MDEGIISDTGDTVRDCDARHAAAAHKGVITDAGYAIRNRDASKASTFIERGNTDGGDAIRDVVIGSFFPFRVSN